MNPAPAPGFRAGQSWRWTYCLPSMRRLFVWIFLVAAPLAGKASAAEPASDPWASLDFGQERVDEKRFRDALDHLYAAGDDWSPYVRIERGAALLTKAEGGEYRLRLAKAGSSASFAGLRGKGSGLSGLRVALDPGHIGGRWGPMERRSFSIGDGPVVQEGDLVLAVAKRLRSRLESLGAIVWITRPDSEPATSLRPSDFREEAAKQLSEESDGAPLDDAAVEKQAERLFYLSSEIQARADKLNAEFHPDLTIALHLNAVGWPDPEHHSLVAANSGHVIVHGRYLSEELADDEMRRELFRRLLRGYDRVELPLARAMASAMVDVTGLPPYQYTQDNALKLDSAGYVWARNLMANRIFESPVIYLEPWILNGESVYPWAAAGDYDGMRRIGGRFTESLPVVYASFVMEGLRRYYEADQ